MTLTTIWSIFTKILDIAIVWLVFYYILKNYHASIEILETLQNLVDGKRLKDISDLPLDLSV